MMYRIALLFVCTLGLVSCSDSGSVTNYNWPQANAREVPVHAKRDGLLGTWEVVWPDDYEPDEESILADLLPRGVATQIFAALLENGASEQGARMSAMDNATRNAGEMIDNLTIEFNRSRQAVITNELIEIISGAEAL